MVVPKKFGLASKIKKKKIRIGLRVKKSKKVKKYKRNYNLKLKKKPKTEPEINLFEVSVMSERWIADCSQATAHRPG